MENIIQKQNLDNIYQMLSGMNLLELNQVMNKVMRLRKQKLPTVLSKVETELIRKINKGLPLDIQKRYDFLLIKKKAQELSNEEYAELLEITSFSEQFNVQRLESVVELSKIRNKPFDELILKLGLKSDLNVA
jgi:hypothetical protein